MRKYLLTAFCGMLLVYVMAQPVCRLAECRDLYTSGTYDHSDSSFYTYSGNRGGIDEEGSAVQFDLRNQYTGSTGNWYNAMRYTLTYNAANQRLVETDEKNTVSGWVNYNRYINNYDGNGNLTRYAIQAWDTLNQTWHDTYVTEYIYDGNNDLRSQFDINTNLGNFGPTSLDSFIYDGSHHKLRQLYYSWSSGSREYVYDIAFTYDGAGNQLKANWQQWNGTALEDYQIDSSIYDGNNNRLNETYITWHSGMWQTFNRYQYQYDAHNNLLQEVDLLPDNAHTGWKNSSRTTNTYDVSNNKTSVIYEYDNGGTWVNSTRRVYVYNAGIKVTSDSVYNWASGAWVPAVVYDIAYNANGYPSVENQFSYVNNAWMPYSVYRSWYNDATDLNETTKTIEAVVYPNPASNQFKLTFTAEKPGTASLLLYDMAGRLITTTYTTVEAGSNTIQWNAFALTKGVYLYQLNIPGAVGRGKLLAE